MRLLSSAGEASFRGKTKKKTKQTHKIKKKDLSLDHSLGLGMQGVTSKQPTTSLSTEAESQQKISNLLFRDYP